MAFHFQLRRPVCCRTPTSENSQFGIKPVLGLPSRSFLRFQEVKISATTRMLASAGYSKRRQRRSLIPKTKTSIPKGFTPRSRLRNSIRKKDKNDAEEKENSGNLSFSDPTLPNSSLTDKRAPDEVQTIELDSTAEMLIMLGDAIKKGLDILETLEQQGLPDLLNFTGVPSVDTNGGQFKGQIADNYNEGDGPALRITIDHNDKEIRKELMTDKISDLEKQISCVKDHIGRLSIAEKASIVSENEERPAAVECNLDTRNVIQPAKAHEIIENTVIDSEESLLKQKVDKKTRAQRLLESLANDMFARGKNVFVISKLVTPKNSFKVFFNRSLSVLANEPDVMIKGAYNGWRWKFFTKRLHKTNLRGDWWSCQLPVPKEAYRVDFVFYNGANTYENNSSNDFSFILEGGMDETEFEDFLLEEKHKELERLAAKQAEKERQVEEQQRKEEEKAAREADKAQAKMDVEKRRHGLQIAKKLTQSSHHLWKIEPSLFKGGDKVRLYYNRSSGPLAHSTEIWIHGSHNNWSEGLSIIEKLSHSEKTDGDWWFADVVVPDQALILDWVFADGPPEKAIVYDNNNLQDFHVIVPTSVPEKLFWLEEENRIYKKLREDRRSKEEAVRKKAEETARMKAETKERTMKMFLLSQTHTVYTDPVDVQAGSVVNVFYNPYNTILNGKREVWFRCSFNRWSHHNGPLPPQKMVPANNGSHVKATVRVPMDAYMLDFVFSEKVDGGIYDNENEMDYHIPVNGGIMKEPPMHIIQISSEMAPIAKVGGLGDVVTSLSRAVQELGHKVDIVLPKYNCMDLSDVKYLHCRSSFVCDGREIKVWFGKVEGLSVNFLEPQDGMFSVGCIYGRNDDAHRFGSFCHAALEFLLQSGYQPDILHCHDWTSAPVAWLFKEHYSQCALHNARVIFTIHNLEFGIHHIARAMKFAHKATTVSPTYSREISGNPTISPHLHKFYGILNGIDPDIWDPYNDQFIPVSYTSENVVEGKKAAKEALQQRLGLRISDHPLVGVITRLTIQKGVHLIKHAISRTLEHNGQVVLLGSSPDPRIQNDFTNLANRLHASHGDRVRFCLTYDEPLSHLIYAGADFILVPSIFEPCGLTQLTAMRYGSIPIVRKTGGLYDTVFDVDNEKERAQEQGLEPNGFCFEGADAYGVDYALNRAISAWYDAREWLNSLCKRVMRQDWSWNRPALNYIELYHSARK